MAATICFSFVDTYLLLVLSLSIPALQNVGLDVKVRILSGLEADILKIIYFLLAILENGRRWDHGANLRYPNS